MSVEPIGVQGPAGERLTAPRPERPSPKGLVTPGASAAASRPTEADGLALSPQAETFRRARLALGGLPGAGQAAVIERLRSLVRQGAYRPGGADIARAMLDDPSTASLLGFASRR